MQTIVWYGITNSWIVAQLFIYFSFSSSLSSLHPLLYLLWIFRVEKPALSWLVTVSMEDLIWDIDRTSICEETESSTERKLPIELRAKVLHPSVAILIELILVVIRVRGAAMKRQRRRQWYV